MALGQVFLRVIRFFPISINPPQLHTPLHLHVTLIPSTNRRSVVTLQNQSSYRNRGELEKTVMSLSLHTTTDTRRWSTYRSGLQSPELPYHHPARISHACPAFQTLLDFILSYYATSGHQEPPRRAVFSGPPGSTHTHTLITLQPYVHLRAGRKVYSEVPRQQTCSFT